MKVKVKAKRLFRFETALERWMFVLGAALCLFYVGAMTYRAAGSRLALRTFRLANGMGEAPLEKADVGGVPGAAVDFRLWSEKRIAAYRDALAKQFASPLAVLRVQRLSIEVAVFPSTDELALNRGVGWIAGTARPGEPGGNIGIAGHRDGFFRGLKDISVGDSLTLDLGSQTAQYVVDEIKIVDPTDVTVLAATPSPSLTLVTCYPFYFVGDAPRRFIVRCSLKQHLKNAANTGQPDPLPNGANR